MTLRDMKIAPWKAELWQDGILVTKVEGSHRGFVEREIDHYAEQYLQDGPVEIIIKPPSRKR